MQKLKASEKVRELLAATGLDNEAIEAIEDSFWLQAKKNSEQQVAAEEGKSLSKLQMARKARIIK